MFFLKIKFLILRVKNNNIIINYNIKLNNLKKTNGKKKLSIYFQLIIYFYIIIHYHSLILYIIHHYLEYIEVNPVSLFFPVKIMRG